MKRILLLLSLVLFASCDNSDDEVDSSICEELTTKINVAKNTLNTNSSEYTDKEIEVIISTIKVWEGQKKELGCNF